MRVIIHAGMPKTGTTSIQDTLAANRDRLASAGIHFPDLGGPLASHWQLAEASRAETARRRRSLMDRSLPGWQKQADSSLLNALRHAAREGGAVILSAEALSHPAEAETLATLGRRVEAEGGKTTSLLYLRPPVERLASSFQQNLKDPMRALTLPAMMVEETAIRADVVLGVFGSKRTKLRVFDPRTLLKGDAVTDFVATLGRIGLSLPPLDPVARANESLSGAACAALLVRRHRVQQSEDTSTLLRHYAQARRLLTEFEEFQPKPRLSLPVDWASTLRTHVASDWNRLVDASEHPESDRAFLRYDEGRPGPVPGLADMEAWVMSYRDPAHEEAAAAYGEARDEPWARNGAAFLR